MNRYVLSAVIAVGVAVSAGSLAVPAASADAGTTVTVMTRNLYFGTDLTPVIEAPKQEFTTAVATAYDEAQASDFAERADAWADEIALVKPDLVGLNEAVQWETGPAGGPATTDAGNFVPLLLAALTARGQDYALVSESTGYDVEAPGQFSTVLMDVRLTQHEAILARIENGLTVGNAQSGQYTAVETIPTAVATFTLPWSWASVDVTKNGVPFRIATTHLAADSGAAQVAQAQEFLDGPGSTTAPIGTSGPMIWVGDLNSDADPTPPGVPPGVPPNTPPGVPPNTNTYSTVIAAGFRDSWAATRPGDLGYTCCEAGNLLNPTPILNQRIDYVLTRGAITPVFDFLVGNTVLERDLYGRWASDHAGLVAILNVH
jgi:endonuclease/exonuclease/phosphatase family metal-dependent hydrolase